MASSNVDLQDKYRLYKFTKVLTLKVVQIVVQSRQGKKITHECNAKLAENLDISTPVQWFNLSIPDEPTVNEETKHVLNGEVVDALTKILCIEISLHTTDGDQMVLELWTIKLLPGAEPCSPSTVYYRMSVMLKSTLTISRITPAYKLARAQYKESYKIYHKIYSGEPNYNLLGEKSKTVKVSELHTPIGTLQIEVVYRTKMAILPDERHKIEMQKPTNDIMVKSDHFKADSPKKCYDKKEVDLSKPLTAGAFVDTVKIQKLHDALSQQLPPEPPIAWLLAKKEKMEKVANKQAAHQMVSDHRRSWTSATPEALPHIERLELAQRTSELAAAACEDEASGSTAHAVSNAIEMPKPKNSDKYSALMEFPFADGSPIADLANFYQECLHARSMSDEWTDVFLGPPSMDSESLSRQLKMFEDAVPEFDNMVASMCNNSEAGSDRS